MQIQSSQQRPVKPIPPAAPDLGTCHVCGAPAVVRVLIEDRKRDRMFFGRACQEHRDDRKALIDAAMKVPQTAGGEDEKH